MANNPFEYHPHAVALALWAVLLLGVLVLTSERRSTPRVGRKLRRPLLRRRLGAHLSSKEKRFLLAAVAIGAIDTSYPMADLATRYSVLAYLMENVILGLCVAPLLVLSTPRWLIAQFTQGRVRDRIVRTLTRSLPATFIFCGSYLGSMSSVIANAQANSGWVRTGLHVELLLASVIMWITALRKVPGARNLGTGGQVAFLFAQSLIPSFPIIVLVFAKHPLYAAFAHNVHLLGMSALADQQLAAVAAKFLAIAVLWGASLLIILKASTREELGLDPEELTWDDVKRELDRTEKRAPRQHENY